MNVALKESGGPRDDVQLFSDVMNNIAKKHIEKRFNEIAKNALDIYYLSERLDFWHNPQKEATRIFLKRRVL